MLNYSNAVGPLFNKNKIIIYFAKEEIQIIAILISFTVHDENQQLLKRTTMKNIVILENRKIQKLTFAARHQTWSCKTF